MGTVWACTLPVYCYYTTTNTSTFLLRECAWNALSDVVSVPSLSTFRRRL